MKKLYFISYTSGVCICFEFQQTKGVWWKRDILKAVQKTLKENGIKARICDIGTDSWQADEIFNSGKFPKYSYNKEKGEFIKID